MRRLVNWWIKAIILSTMSAGTAYAQYPDHPIHLLVPYPPGGLIDTMARTMQEPLSKALGQPVIVDNKPGAAGAIATRSVAQASPDGYTLIFGNNGPSALLPLVQKDKALSDVLAQQNMQDRFHSYGANAAATSPEELARRIAEEVPKWRNIVETAHITAQ
jgi:tripartite-type tricarboxylate transporter receptor subunit TctC